MECGIGGSQTQVVRGEGVVIHESDNERVFGIFFFHFLNVLLVEHLEVVTLDEVLGLRGEPEEDEEAVVEVVLLLLVQEEVHQGLQLLESVLVLEQSLLGCSWGALSCGTAF